MTHFGFRIGWAGIGSPPEEGMRPYAWPCVVGTRTEWDLYWSHPKDCLAGEGPPIDWPFVEGYEPDDAEMSALGFRNPEQEDP